MNKKQSKGLVLAAVIFIVAGVISVLTNAVSAKITEKQNEASKNSMDTLMKEFSGNSQKSFSDMPVNEDFIAVVNIEGTIQASPGTTSLYSNSGAYDHDYLIKYVNKLIKNDRNKGIILRMNTPGGTVYEADEMYLKIKEYKEETGRPVWVYMENMCCSGGVYIASAADEQYANRMTNTGSIGVIISSYDMSELYEKLGIKEVNIVSAKNKAMGSSGTPMTSEQKAIYQAIIDEYYDRFVGIVAEGRNMSVDAVKKLADGRIYTAVQAEENGLIDGIKGSEEFDQYVKDQSGVSKFYEPATATNYFAQLFGGMSKAKEKSEAEVLVDLMNELGSGVPMYYAEPIGK